MSVTTAYFEAADGIRLAWREMGEGRPVLLLHGYFSEADTNWIKYGHARLLADAGFRVIMPDLRAHGLSGKPHDPVHYPSDILADDQVCADRLSRPDRLRSGRLFAGRTDRSAHACARMPSAPCGDIRNGAGGAV